LHETDLISSGTYISQILLNKSQLRFHLKVISSFSCSFFSCSPKFWNKYFSINTLEKLKMFIYGTYGKINKPFLSWKLSKQNCTSNELEQLEFKPLGWNSLRLQDILELLLFFVIQISFYIIWRSTDGAFSKLFFKALY